MTNTLRLQRLIELALSFDGADEYEAIFAGIERDLDDLDAMRTRASGELLYIEERIKHSGDGRENTAYATGLDQGASALRRVLRT